MPVSKLFTPLVPRQVANTPHEQLKKQYDTLAAAYNRIADGDVVYCSHCSVFYTRVEFYADKRHKSGVMCYCKDCMEKLACDYDKGQKIYIDNSYKAMRVLEAVDKPYLDSVYKQCVKDVQSDPEESRVTTGWKQYMRQLTNGLANYRNLTWKDSEFGTEDPKTIVETSEDEKRIIAAGKKRFGDFTDQELLLLMNEYQDWVNRYECNTKAQEKLFESLSFNELETYKARKAGASTKDLEKTRMDLLNTANITPKQQVTDPTSNAQVLGTLIQRWEETRPLPEIDEDLRDVDKIGLLIEVFFRGHMAKLLNLKNPFSNIYEKFMAKYTVNPPTYDEDNDSETMFDKIFGTMDDD